MNESKYIQWDAKFASTLYGTRTAKTLNSSQQSRRELRQILNTRPDPIDQRDYLYEPSLVGIPARYFNPYCTDRLFRIKEQGSEGTCVGQALASVIDIQNLIRFKVDADVPARVSSRFLYTNARLYDHHPEDSLAGSSLRGAIKGFYHNGACDEHLARYQVMDEDFKINNAMWHDARRVALGTYFRLEHVLNHYHCALLESGSILCSALIHSGWNQDAVKLKEKGQHEGRIKYPTITRKKSTRGYDKTASELLGGHAFVIVGYDETGFLVLNSWGNLWGRFPVTDLLSDYTHPLGDRTLPGIAHWSYADWADNVLDAWILRLAAPTGHGTDFIGGRPSRMAKKEVHSGTARKRDVHGHYMHVHDGILVSEPPYENDLGSFREIAEDLRHQKDKKHYRHLVFFAHGGLNTLDSASARAAAMIPTFKKNGIYPVFFFWRTGFGHMLGSVIEGILPAVEQRSSNYEEMRDSAIERLAKPIGRAIWNDIRRNAEACFNKDFRDYCKKTEEYILAEENSEIKRAWDATAQLINIVTDDSEKYPNKPLKLHFIGHSAGALLLGELFKRMENTGILNRSNMGTVNLLAPCCRTSFFIHKILPICEYLGNKRLTVFNLSPEKERRIDPTIYPYQKSFATLVSNAFYDKKPEHITALDEFWKEDVTPVIKSSKLTAKVDYTLSEDIDKDGVLKCSADHHADFDNNADTMNYILKKILGRHRSEQLSPATDGFTPEQLNRGGF